MCVMQRTTWHKSVPGRSQDVRSNQQNVEYAWARMVELGGTRPTNDVSSDTAVSTRLTYKPRTNPTQLTYWHPNGIKTGTCHVTSLYKAGAAINFCGVGGRGGKPWQNAINKRLMSVPTADTEQSFAQSFY